MRGGGWSLERGRSCRLSVVCCHRAVAFEWVYSDTLVCGGVRARACGRRAGGGRCGRGGGGLDYDGGSRRSIRIGSGS